MDRQNGEIGTPEAADDGSHPSDHSDCIAPPMPSLMDLDQSQIDTLLESVPGGIDNLHDAYPLSPLQEGMLFHHLLNERNDTYVLLTLIELKSYAHVCALIEALQKVVDRHDVLRTAVIWEKLPRPMQVVCRRASLPVEELDLDTAREPIEQLKERMRPEHHRFDLCQAPLMRMEIAAGKRDARWYALLRIHHIICDHQSWDAVLAEALICLRGCEKELAAPVSYRSYVAWARANAQTQDAETFFRDKLGQIQEPTTPFGVVDAHRDSSLFEEAHEAMDSALAHRIRIQARRLGIGAARLFHAAWGLVVARTSGRDDILYGTVLLSALRRSSTTQRIPGLFVNTLPLRLQLRGVTARQLVDQTCAELAQLLNFEQASLTLAQQCSSVGGTVRLFTSVLNYRHSVGHSVVGPHDSADVMAGLRVLSHKYQTDYPIGLTVDNLGDGFSLTTQTDRRIDPHRIISYMQTTMRSLIDALEEAPETPALSLTILPDDERHQILQTFNSTQVAYPEDRSVHELFEEQAQNAPDLVAAMHAGKSLTYAELNSRANQLARYLRNEGVAPDQPVGVCVERGLEMIIALLGILKAGGAYVPLDPNYPLERLQYMLADSAPRVVLTQTHLINSLPLTQAQVIALDSTLTELAGHTDENLSTAELGLGSKHLVYVIYTSGSTGLPKATAMAHRSMVNLIDWHRRVFGPGEGTRVLQFAALSFDVAFQEIFSTLCTGGTLVLLDEWTRRDARALTAFLSDHSIQRLFVPPLMLQAIAEHAKTVRGIPGGLRDVITAGEQLRISPEVCALFQRLDGCRLHNHYGPTETHVVTALTLTGDPRQWPALPSIGRPISNTQIYVLDSQQQPMPIDVAGEIFIGGAGIARGYLGRSELTAQRFINDPFGATPDTHLYRSGDLGRWRADGTLEYLGRSDFQIKIRGYRIELGEIEAQLSQHASVKEAAVIAREDVPGDKRLVAYVTRHEEYDPNTDELRAYLKNALPQHMVPTAIVILDALPLTPNGKLDRQALPTPDLEAYTSRQYEPPQGEMECILAGIWQELLRVERVGRQDSFFELGGHSLLIVQMVERLRRVGLSIEVRRVFESSTLSDLARVMTNEPGQPEVPPNLIPAACDAITPPMLPLIELTSDQIERIARQVPEGTANIQDMYALGPLQEGLLFHHRLNHERRDTYMRQMLVSLESRQKMDEFVAALQAAIDRHDILRTAIVWKHLPQPVQVVYRRCVLPVETITLDRAHDPVKQLRELMSSERQNLDLTRAPLMRLLIASDPGGVRWYAVLKTHHIVCDNESLQILLSEITAHLQGRKALPVPLPYRNFVAQTLLRSRTDNAEAFFRIKLADVVEPTAPFGLLDLHAEEHQIETISERLDSLDAGAIRKLARIRGVTPATLFHAVWALVIARLADREDIVFGTVLLGRFQGSAGAQATLGMFINTLPLRLNLSDLTTSALVEHTQQELAELLCHEQASLAVAQRCSGVPGSAPLFNSLLNFRHSARDHGSELARAGVTILASQGGTNYPIILSVDDQGDGFTLEMETDQRIDARRMLGYVTTTIKALTQTLETDPQTPALTLSMLPQAELHQVLDLFNPIKATDHEQGLVHEMFEEQVERAPNARAVTFEGRTLTYAEVNRRANQLARYLREKGVGPDQLVGVCVERSAEMVVALLAVLKAGGAYVPLDPSYPTDRLAYLLNDAQPKALIIQERVRDKLPQAGGAVISLDQDWAAITERASGNLPAMALGLRPHHLAYVIYTSGSTGNPKGVMVEHNNVARLFAATEQWFQFDERDVWTLFHSFAFDFSVWELWGALCYGGRVVIVPYRTSRSPEQFYRLVCDEHVTVLNQTPSAFTQFIDAHLRSAHQHHLRLVIFGGEALEFHTLLPWVARNGAESPQLVNMYGITETTVHVTYRRLSRNEIETERGSIVGTPIPDLRVYLLDRQARPVPIGAIGEIYVGGSGVARGYLNRRELSKERFLPDPFSGDPQARMYKSGDLARWRPDGAIEYLGRNDLQTKIRGFRIEVGEIEAQLVRGGLVKEAAVMAREDVPGAKRLVAYVVPRETLGAVTLNVEALRAQLGTALPPYMIPSAFVILERFPLSPNGKLDRRALPEPELSAYTTQEYRAPQGEVEQTLAEIWQELLRLTNVSRDANFFELGGHSLLATRVISGVRERLQVELPVRAIFDAPTIQRLAALLETEREMQVTEDARWTSDLSRDIRHDIDEMGDDQVLEEIAQLQKELESATGNSAFRA